MVPEDLDIDIGREDSPVGHLQGDFLVIVQHRNAWHGYISLSLVAQVVTVRATSWDF